MRACKNDIAKIDARAQRSRHQLRVVRRRNVAHTCMYAAGARTCMHACMHRLHAHFRKTSRRAKRTRNTPQGVRALAHTQSSTPRTQTEQHTGTRYTHTHSHGHYTNTHTHPQTYAHMHTHNGDVQARPHIRIVLVPVRSTQYAIRIMYYVLYLVYRHAHVRAHGCASADANIYALAY